MRNQQRQFGMTLTELLVVVAVMTILLGISVPTAKKLASGFDASTGVRQLINAALSNGRAIAVREQAYAGVRFQQKDDVTYMVLIVHDYAATGDEEGFCAVIGRKPMALPEGVTVSDATVVFSPAGKLINHRVRCMAGTTNDSIFNTQDKVDSGYAMFVEDEEADEQDSVRTLDIETNEQSATEQISPYTGELIIEYKTK